MDILRFKFGFICLCLGFFSVSAQAQSLSIDIETAGTFSFGYSDRTPGTDVFLVGDATLRLGFSGFGSGLPLGVELGTFGRADALDTPHETYGAFTFDFPSGARILAGVPRPAYDSFAVSGLEALFPSLGIDRALITRSVATTDAMTLNAIPLGLRFQNETADLRYAASLLYVDKTDSTLASFGMAQDFGTWMIEGAVEASFGTTTVLGGKVQVSGTMGQMSGGFGYYAPIAAGAPDMVEAFATYSPTDRLSLSSVVQVPIDSAIDPTLGLSAQYDVRDELGLSVGVISDAGADASLTAHLTWRF